ncbi:transposase-like protein [Gordonia humi]|uniref:Transposase-like protein n=1 Tax=Gordonia humi TaxID=686429 RepID=A0A840F6D1_9ACTN|nr:transposase-like protein [Gordonia humi]
MANTPAPALELRDGDADELAASKAERTKLETERDILRQAAKYFAGETNW